jgi:hypothetical protein
LLNDPTYVEAARGFAARLIRESPTEPSVRLERAFRLALARSPRSDEVSILRELLLEHREQYQHDPTNARDLLGTGDTPAPRDIEPAELAAWTSVTRVLLNLHETITRN